MDGVMCQGRLWSPNEVQALVLQVKSFRKASVRLGVTEAELRKFVAYHEIKSPTAQMQSRAEKDPIAFMRLVLSFSSIDRAAKFLNVSQTSLKLALQNYCGVTKRPSPTTEEATAALEQSGSLALAAKRMDCTVHELKQVVPDWRELRDPTKAGFHSLATGRIGEAFVYETLKAASDGVVWSSKDCHNHPGFDVSHPTIGKIDVKTSPVVLTKDGQKFTWVIDPVKENVDAWFLVGLSVERIPCVLREVRRSEFEGSVAIKDTDLYSSQGLVSATQADGKRRFSTTISTVAN